MAPHLIAYASTSLIPPGFAEKEIADIVACAQRRNARDDVTGVLLYSQHRRFAQALEGEAAAVTAIMNSIQRDVRHCKIIMLHDGPAAARRFSSWSLAYRGDAPQIDHVIRDAAYEANLASGRSLEVLLRMMEEMAAGVEAR